MAKKILIVEDESELALLLQTRLSALGYDVALAYDGVQGLDMARKMCPDMILLDVMMPRMDGFEVARMLKFDDKYKRVPIIMMTARSEQSDFKMGEKVHVDDYVIKPYDANDLIARVKKMFDESVKTEE